jgi:hypothetical protein
LRIVLDVRQTADGRLAGDLRMAGSGAARQFEGIIELVGLIEVFLANPQSAPGTAGADTTNSRSQSGPAPV